MNTKYDSFFSYAGEDEKISSEIVGALKAVGFRIWYAPVNLMPGEKLLDSIEKGMAQANSGMLLISQAYLNKGWTNYEMDTLIRNHIENEKKVFPIWHNVEKADIEKRHPGLSGIIGVNTNIRIPMLISKLTDVLSKFAPTLGVIPSYESPSWRFLQGRSEITIGSDGPATTLWEFLIYEKDEQYPLYLDSKLYSKEDLLWEAAQLLPHIPDIVDNWVGKEGRYRIWDMCRKTGIDPKIFE